MSSPAISIVVPTFNSARAVDRCLEALVNQRIRAHEIIVVDGGSNDKTVELAEGYSGVRVIKNRRSHFPGSSRNLGAQASSGNIVLFLDSDCKADNMLVAYHQSAYSTIRGLDGVQGILRASNQGEMSKVIESQFLTQYWLENLRRDGTVKFHSAAVSNLSLRRSTFLNNKFTEGLVSCDDVELFIKLRRNKAKVLFEPRAVAYHPHPENIRLLFQQRKWYGQGFVHLRRQYPRFRFRKNSMFDTSLRYLRASFNALMFMLYEDHSALCEGCTLYKCRVRDRRVRTKRRFDAQYLRQITCLGFAAGVLKTRFGVDYDWKPLAE
jgi:glycosyltransferase involved in cell wall biosynthesis